MRILSKLIASIASLALCTGLASFWSMTAHSAPLCNGPTSVTDLGSEGCTFGELTFSDFSFSGAAGIPFNPPPMNPDDILVDIAADLFSVNILDRVPGIGLVVTPRDPADWQTSGMFSAVNIALSYVVTATGATLDQYQMTAAGPAGSLRGPRFSAGMTVDAGDRAVTTGSFGPYLQIGNMAPGTTQAAVTTTGGASPGLFGGNIFLSFVRNVFTVSAQPVPSPGTLSMTVAALGLLMLRRRSHKSTQAI